MLNRIEIFRGDITTLAVDAIVNAANQFLRGGGGVDGAIHSAAGPDLETASSALAPCHPGNAVLTPGFNLPARFVIHAVGPVYDGGDYGESDKLRATYESALRIASEQRFETIAFPCISTGAFGFPQGKACKIAIATVADWQQENEYPKVVVFCCYDSFDDELYQERFEELGISIQVRE